MQESCLLQNRKRHQNTAGSKTTTAEAAFCLHRLHAESGIITSDWPPINARHHHLRSSRFIVFNENEFRISPSRIRWKTQTIHHGRPRSPCLAAKGYLPSSSTPRGLSILIVNMCANLGRENVAQRVKRI